MSYFVLKVKILFTLFFPNLILTAIDINLVSTYLTQNCIQLNYLYLSKLYPIIKINDLHFAMHAFQIVVILYNGHVIINANQLKDRV